MASAQFQAARLQPVATILRQEQENNGDGTFRYAYETSDGTRAESSGYIKNPGAPEDETIQVIQGYYQHYSPEGNAYTVSYVADENGFQATGDHLPTPPPSPEAIQKSLDIIYRNAGLQQQRAGQPSRFTALPARG